MPARRSPLTLSSAAAFAASLALLPLVFAALAPAARLAGQSDPPPPLVKEHATVKVGDHTYQIPDGNVPLVPNVGIVTGSAGTLVIDPGLGRRNGETILREVAKVARASKLYVASTHFHAEHTTGYAAFPAGTTFISAAVQQEELAEQGAEQIALFSKRFPGAAALLEGATPPKADVTFDRTHLLDLGDVRVQLVVVGPTHTRGDTGFFVESDGVLFSGDVVMKDSFLMATGVTSMNAWLKAFDVFEALRPRVIVPAHGASGDGTLIPANRSIMRDIQARAREMKAQGYSSDDVAAAVRKELWAKHTRWPRADGLYAAARAAYAEAP